MDALRMLCAHTRSHA